MTRCLFVGLCVLWACTCALADDPAGTPAWPSAHGAAFAMRDGNVISPLVAFDAKGRKLLAFNCAPRGRALIGRYYDLVCDGGSFQVRDVGAWIGMQVVKSGAFSIEVTLTADEAKPSAPGVVVAFTDDKGEDAALVQDHAGLSLRLGGAERIELFAPTARKPTHLLVSVGQNNWAVYESGKQVRSGTRPPGTVAWGTREVVFGAAWSGEQPWRGRMEAIAIFPRALTAEEAAGEADAIAKSLAIRKPPTTIRFRGTLLRQAKTASVKEIAPYTRSLTAAEYKVDKVLAGQWQQPTITVLQWMIIDARRLPLADRAPGLEVELSVEPFAENPQLESCRRDDEINGDVPADMFYCENENATGENRESESKKDQR